MKLLWNEKVYGWWSVTGLVGKNANWFVGFSRKPPSPAQPIPPTADPRTVTPEQIKAAGEKALQQYDEQNPRCSLCGMRFGHLSQCRAPGASLPAEGQR